MFRIYVTNLQFKIQICFLAMSSHRSICWGHVWVFHCCACWYSFIGGVCYSSYATVVWRRWFWQFFVVYSLPCESCCVHMVQKCHQRCQRRSSWMVFVCRKLGWVKFGHYHWSLLRRNSDHAGEGTLPCIQHFWWWCQKSRKMIKRMQIPKLPR